MSKFGVPTEQQLTKINRLAKRTLSADEVFAFSGKSAGDIMIPGRYIRLSPELLKVMIDDAQKGVSFMLNHNWSSFGGIQGIPYGKVFDGRIEQSTADGETVSMILDKFIVRDNETVDGVSNDALIKKIETGVLSDTSIGWTTNVMTCSVCGMNYYSRDCSHWKGQTYDLSDGTKKLCTVTAMPPSLIIPYNNNALMEESIVWDGAYPGAMVTQAKHGDVIELPTGNFTVIQDKLELPENTSFYGKYHNGDIVTMVKKSEHKKVFTGGNVISDDVLSLRTAHELENLVKKTGKAGKSVCQALKLKGGEKPMNEKLKKMLETLGVSFEEGKTTMEELCNQIAEKFEALPPAEHAEHYMTQEHAKEKLGKELSADELLKLATDGQCFASQKAEYDTYRQQTIDNAIAMGVRAMGNDFPVDTWKATFASMGKKAIEDITKTWETQAKADIPAGRLTNPEANSQKQSQSIPEEMYQVGR